MTRLPTFAPAPISHTGPSSNMIIVPPDSDDKHQAPANEMPPDDPPPTYTEHVPAPSVATNDGSMGINSATTSTQQQHSNVKPSNYISISRMNGHIKGNWVLDPALNLPTFLLPALSPDETEKTRRNLNLSAMNGYIDADITLAASNHRDAKQLRNRKRVTLYAKSSNGGVKAKMHCPEGPRLPFYFELSTSNGAVNINLPRSFHGPILIKMWNGSPKFSPEMSNHLTTFSDVNKVHKCFIGDYSGMSDDGRWEGDEVVIEARNGSVRIQYDDEAQDRSERKAGFFGKLFGF